MKVADFSIGLNFTNATGVDWRCTDVGTRTILAIKIDPARDPAWYKGPPYLVDEVVFDERAMSGCFTSLENALIERAADSYHPGYPGEAVKTMMRVRRSTPETYPNKRLMRYDRVSVDGVIMHPFGAELIQDAWVIQCYCVYTNEFTTVDELEFIKLPVAVDEDYKRAHDSSMVA